MRLVPYKLSSYYRRNIYPRISHVRGTYRLRAILDYLYAGSSIQYEGGKYRIKIEGEDIFVEDKESLHPLMKEKSFIDFIIDKKEDISLFADLGGYRGFYSILASKICRSKTNYCFELSEENIMALKNNIRINNLSDSIQVVNKAVWSEEKALNADTQEDGMSKLEAKDSNTQIKTVTLDNFFRNREKPDAIKIDIEGAEFHALKGGESLLENTRPFLLLELHKKSRLNEFNNAPEDVTNYLEGLGYNIQLTETGFFDDLVIAKPEE